MKTLKTLIVAALALFSGTAFADKMEEVAIGGYCPVCYLAAGKAVKGTTDFKADHEGKTYLFVSQDALDAFNKTPENFIPAYGGYCALGMSLGKKFESDPTVFKVVDGKIYLNKDKEIGAKFSADASGYIAKADAQWKEMKMKEMKMKEEKMKK